MISLVITERNGPQNPVMNLAIPSIQGDMGMEYIIFPTIVTLFKTKKIVLMLLVFSAIRPTNPDKANEAAM